MPTREALNDAHQGARRPATASGLRQIFASFPFSLLSLSFLVVLTLSAHGQLAQDAEIQFDVPAQSLDAALESYMQVTGFQVLYESALTADRFSSEVKGRFKASQALNKMLVGTRLAVRITTEGAFTVLPVSIVRPDAAERRQIINYDVFLGNAQNRIITALCKEAATRPGTYRAALQFSIDQSGLVSDASLLDTTGDQTRDQALTSSLRGLVIGQAPPADMPQPITMLVIARSTNECRHLSR